MDTNKLRNGFGTDAGHSAQIMEYQKALNKAADEIDALRARVSEFQAECGRLRNKSKSYGIACGVMRARGKS